MGIYAAFWQNLLSRLLKEINPAAAYENELPVPELSQLGDRPSAGYNGRLITWCGQVESRTDSSVFRNLAEVIEAAGNLKNKIPGLLHLRIYGNSVLKVAYEPVSFELLIARYRKIPEAKKNAETEKWRLINNFRQAWDKYQKKEFTFSAFWKKINFGHLIYHTGLTVFAHVIRDQPDTYEALLLNLYDESKDLRVRIKEYTEGFNQVYYSLPGHGKNSFQEERTVATLLAFRYPEKYTLFKDSFYTKLSKGLGIKPFPTGEKLFHYYSLVDDFTKNHLSRYPDLITQKNNRLDDACYKDNNNLILAQDILYLTLDTRESTDSVEEETDEDNSQPENPKNDMKQPLNQILYGPPGTGKTYHTISKAVAIASPEFNLAEANRQSIKKEYERLVKEGQVEFITFHQSLSYEDFIEGIKPVEPKEGETYLKYEIKDGLFKRLAERARKVPDAKPSGFKIDEQSFQKSGFYKISLGDTTNPDDNQIYEWCIANGYMALGWGEANNFSGLNENEIQKMVPGQLERFAAQAVNYFIHYIKPNDYVVVTYGNYLFRAIGKVTGTYEYKDVPGLNVHQFRKVEWLLKDVELPYEELYNRQFSQQSIYRLDKREIKRDFFVKPDGDKLYDTKIRNYVLIIDEINRGNVSQIFGELITLIEEDKRTGREEAITITLPYSKSQFSVPPNLYIVGTMNTADRSVEALDTALRRRFVFEEMMPQSSLLSPGRMIWKLWWDYQKVGWADKEYLKVEKPLYNLLGIPADFDDDDKKERIWIQMKEEGMQESQISVFNSLNFSGLNLQLLLETINARLLTLLSRDHLIGHAWLMDVNSLEDLQTAFNNKIIPLLKEYFYNDYAKIGLVLGESFIYKSKAGNEVFARFKDETELAVEYADKAIYTLANPYLLTMQDFISIYQ